MILAHRDVLETASHRSAARPTPDPCWGACVSVGTDRGFDLAVIRRHAVPMVQVGEGLGGAPGLQVAGHADRRPHLPAVQRGAGAQAQQGAVPLRLGRRERGKTQARK